MTKISTWILFSVVGTFSAVKNPFVSSLLQTESAFGDAESKFASTSSNAITSDTRGLAEKNLTCRKCKKIAGDLDGLKSEKCNEKCLKKTAKYMNSCDESCCRTLCKKTENPKRACKKVGYCNKKITAQFGLSQIEACEGDKVRVVWQGYHNIQETENSNCESADIGEQVSDYHDAGYKETFKNNELSAAPGQTRYFKCSSHCGLENNRIEVSCPPPVTAQFGLSQIDACEGDDVKVVWQGYHNIQETKNSSCDSENIGAEISEFHEAGYEKTFSNNELSAAPGETRYFKCTLHCGEAYNRIEVSCLE